jgi:GT2 family glycosyltransferase
MQTFKKIILRLFHFLMSIFLGIFLWLFLLIQNIFLKIFVQAKPKKISSLLDQPLSGISFLIPSWNQAELLEACLKQLQKLLQSEAKNLPYEIIVIDNASTDQSAELLQKFQKTFPLRVLTEKSNLGFAPAINQAAQLARYPYLFLLNNDMLVQEHFLSALIQADRFLRQKKRPYFALSSQVFFFDPKKRREESGRNFLQIQKGKIYLAHCLAQENLQGIQKTLYPGGGSSLINRDAFLALGSFAEKLCQPMYAEDFALGLLAWQAHLPSYFVADSQVLHFHRQSSQKRFTSLEQIIATNILLSCLAYNQNLALAAELLLFASVNELLHPNSAASLSTAFQRLPALWQQRKKLQVLGIASQPALMKDFLAWSQKEKNL